MGEMVEVSDGKEMNVVQTYIFYEANRNVLSPDSQAFSVGADLKCSGSFCKSYYTLFLLRVASNLQSLQIVDRKTFSLRIL